MNGFTFLGPHEVTEIEPAQLATDHAIWIRRSDVIGRHRHGHLRRPSMGGSQLTLSIQLRPVGQDDLAMFRRFAVEPGLIGLDWTGFRDPEAAARRFATDGFLGEDDGRLMVKVDLEQERVAAGFVR